MITVIILTKDEAMHIARCIENVKPIAERVIVVDSFSTDGTQNIARSLGAEVIEHAWPGTQAEQFNWALDNIEITTDWILRLDADEWLSDDLKTEINSRISELPYDVTGIVLKRRNYFMGKQLKHGVSSAVNILRLFRTGKARSEYRLMDEHIVVNEGHVITFSKKFYDDNRMPLSHFIKKHNNYADREATTALMAEYGVEGYDASGSLSESAKRKRSQKSLYYRLPMFGRAFAYFIYRYFLRGGFLNGKAGFVWDYMQGWWYRTLVDAKIMEIKRACHNDPDKIRAFLAEKVNNIR